MSGAHARRCSLGSKPRARLWCGALLSTSVFLAPTRARAEGAPPTVSQLLVDPSDERHLALRSSFGLLVSRDAGATWDWRCKAAMGYKGNAEPAVAILNGGALVIGSAAGITTGDAAGCDFKQGSGIDGRVADVVAVPDTPGAAVAVSVSFTDSSSRVWQSLDSGRTFRALGAILPHFTALSLGVPAALPNRIYMTGLLWAQAVEGAFAVSDDAGKTFTITPVANSDSGAQPYIAAVNPKRADTVYLRLTGLPGRLRVSDDAGRTFREILSMPGPVQGFAVSPSGAQIFASSLEAGIYSADTVSLKFQQVACGGVPCLAATGNALLGCGERGRNGFVAGRSVDQGQSFNVLLDTPCLAPARCGAGTSVGAACAKDWSHVAAQLGEDGARCNPAAVSKPFSRACLTEPARVSDARADKGVSRASTRARSIGCGCTLARGGAARGALGLQAMGLFGAAFSMKISRRRRTRRKFAELT